MLFDVAAVIHINYYAFTDFHIVSTAAYSTVASNAIHKI